VSVFGVPALAAGPVGASDSRTSAALALAAPAVGSGFEATANELQLGTKSLDERYPEGNVHRYGAGGDGETDDSDAIQTAIRACPSVSVPDGAYLIRRMLELRARSCLHGSGTTNGAGYIVSAIGALGKRQTLASDVRRGDNSFTVGAGSVDEYTKAGGSLLQSDVVPLGHPSRQLGGARHGRLRCGQAHRKR
jgi:Pectate lyase superfamily protein